MTAQTEAPTTSVTRLRWMAQRQGLELVGPMKNRDPRAIDYGALVLVDERNCIVAGERMSIDDVHDYLTADAS